MERYVIGIDLGGSKIATCIIDKKGKILKKITIPTLAQEGPASVIARIQESVYDVVKKHNIDMSNIVGIGIGSPGPLDAERGIIKNPPNLLGWNNIPLSEILQQSFRVPVCLENDANAAALGEKLYGSGKGIDNFIYITISTGIGGGLVVGDKIFKGSNGNACEIGHMTINFEGPRCGCGNKGCWEAYASGTALARFALKGINKGIKTIIKDIAGKKDIKAEHVFLAAKQGDEFAIQIVDREGYYLGVGLANVVNIFNPKCISIGGGLTHEWDMFSFRMLQVMKEYSLKANLENLKVVKATLGPDVGVVGAAAVAWGIIGN